MAPRRPSLVPRVVRTAIAAGALAAAGCVAKPAPELRIGIVALASGPLAPILGLSGQRGAELAAADLNAAGGVLIGGVAHRVVIRIRPSEPRPDAAATAVGALINIDSVDAVVAPLTSVLAAPAAGVAEAARVVFIAPMASNPSVTAGREFAFRLAFSDAFQGELLAKLAFDSLGYRRVAALSDEASSYGQEIVRIFRERFEALGGRMVAEEGFAADGPNDFRPQLRRIVAARPQALLLPNYLVFDSTQVRQARELGFEGRFLGSDSWDPGAIMSMPLATGTLIVANWDSRSPRPEAQRFVERFKAVYGEAPRTAAAATFDAVRILALAASRVSVDTDSVFARAVANLGAFTGASADFRFAGASAPQRGGVVIEVLSGRDSLRLVMRPDD